MENNLTSSQKNFIDGYLLPTIHPHLDVLLPHLFDKEHGKYDEGKRAWKSKYHLDDGSRDGKFTTWAPLSIRGKSTPHLLFDFGRGGYSREVLNEIANRSYNGSRGKAIEDLSHEYGLTKEYESMYRKEITPEMRKRIEEEEQISVDLGIARDIFMESLWNENDGEARKALEYMRARGWSDEDIKAGEIGFISSSIKAKVMEVTKKRIMNRWNEAIGDSHTIAIPLYVNGRMSAFQFRTILPDAEIDEKEMGKYQYENVPKPYFYGFSSGIRSVVITEGMLDYVHAMTKKFPSLITSGGTPSNTQIANLLRYAQTAQSYTLFFDDDKGGRRFTNRLANAIIAKGRKDAIRIAFMESIEGVNPKDIDEWIGEMDARGIDSLEMYNKSIQNSLVYDEWKPIDIALTFAEGVLLKGETDRKKRNRGFSTITPEMIENIAKMATKEAIRDFKQTIKQFLAQCDKEYIDNAMQYLKPWERVLNCDISALIVTEVENITRAKNEAIQSNVKRLYGAWKDGDTTSMRKIIEELNTITSPEKVDDVTLWSEYGTKAVSDLESVEAIHDELSTEPDGIPTCIAFTDGTPDHFKPLMLDEGLTFLCANTGHGKTSILNRIAVDEAIRNRKMGTDKGVMYFTYEISRQSLIRDLLNIYVDDEGMSKWPRGTIKNYFKTRGDSKFAKKTMYDEESGVTHYAHFLQRKDEFLEHYIKRNGYINIIQESLSYEAILKVLESYIKETKRRHDEGLGKDISIICLDYAQLLFTEEEMIRTEQISTICKGLNDMGRKYHIPIVMPAQFNQSVLSPWHMDLRCIGEGGGFSRYGVAVIGFFLLNFLKKIGDGADGENIKILKRLGIEFHGGIGAIPNIMYAKAMKLRNGEWVPAETLLYWNPKLKTIEGNANPYIIDPSMAKVDGMSIREAIDQGRNHLEDVGRKMMDAINEAKNEEGANIAHVGTPESIMKTIASAIIRDEDDMSEHPEYFENGEGDLFTSSKGEGDTNAPLVPIEEMVPEAIPDEVIDVWDENYIPPEYVPF